jgi:hypothetical protein
MLSSLGTVLDTSSWAGSTGVELNYAAPPNELTTNVWHVGLAEALELCLLLREDQPARCNRAALRWHGRYCREVDVTFEESPGYLATPAALSGERKGNAAFAPAELLSRRGSCGSPAQWLFRGLRC